MRSLYLKYRESLPGYSDARLQSLSWEAEAGGPL